MRNLITWGFWIKGRLPIELRHWGREYYIPLKPRELLRRLAELDEQAELNGARGTAKEEPEQFRILGKRFIDLVHQRYRSHHEKLIRLYDAFDPDADIRQAPPKLGGEAQRIRDVDCRRLFSEIANSLHLANYRRLTPLEIQDTLKAASHWGVRLRIRFSSFRRLEVYGRGDIIAKRFKRNWWKWFRLQECDVPIYQRLVVVFRTKEMQSLPEILDPECVHVRMFKNIPKADVDMMLPGSQVRLSWTDTSKIGIPTVWGMVVLATKLVKSFWVLTIVGAISFLSSFALVVAISIASIVYAIKSVFSYSTTKQKYQLNVARNLYYQNLDNNLGALLRVIDEAEQQESCEAILAYFVMHKEAKADLFSEGIDRKAEAILKSLVGIDVDFDIQDALRNLTAIGIVLPQPDGWRVMSVAEAIQKLKVGEFGQNTGMVR